MNAADSQRRAWLKAGALLPLAPSMALATATSSATASAAATVYAGATAIAAAPTLPVMPARPAGTPQQVAADESYWRQIAAQYDITNEVAMLDNAFWGSMSRPVLAAYEQHVAEVNRGNSYYGRTQFPPAFGAARRRAAEALGVSADEIVFTRGATEALQILIGSYNKLRPGDVVLCADIDYDNMITTLHWLKQRRGVEVVSIAMPEPFTHQSVIDCYAQAMARHPKLKLMLLTHVNHRNGMVLPVAEINRMARERGIDTIVDTAHGFGQLDMRLPDLQADFAGINLHKWIGAPIGVGAIYIRRGRVQDIDPYMGETDRADIRTRVHTGTLNFAAYLALPQALDLHEQVGVAYKQARLARLRQRWLDAVRDVPGLQLLASDDPRLSSAIAAFRLRGRTSMADNVALARRLLKEHGVFTVERDGLAGGACVRATPSIFTLEAEVDRLSAALRKVAA
ncbi:MULTISPECIES: aminotransferase class V-fold PLP-dependent enzyme [unclassified Duganella]|uniref:aminotransferase class V-fold PLP-dependent enzyme n=1 Tax=unclassified Duganella TaxID=2636909 RepID=UPI00087EFCFD|nr:MULTISPECIES: aminotransferase class V-fold PLP-dependent enzyme [unclassified Duganella]SDH24924.1 Selenocysteine lyase/Cysteine desulfurase [Duganella sp. OV458]SDK43306.1 Selenocysteine lyase/Cysteine desulfurase [Duganella sp. OV510]